MALPSAFLEELRARTPLPALVGRRAKLTRSGRHWKACCPFHGEKTPSFYVYDDHYHCFGCGAHGDGIGFVMQSQGTSFMEAVELLAAEAGLEVPKATPEAAEAEKRRIDLFAVLSAAKASFQRRLFLPEGRYALDYLRARGLTDETIRRFGLGWSGEGRGALAAELGRVGITADQLVETGLMRRDDGVGRLTESFFSRVMFPIQDRRGRTISFGGRLMADGHPKYINGPETELFRKRETVFGLDLAREGIRNGAELVLVEGYMDVIALHQAGFMGAVAPLGTALTEQQLMAVWRLSPAPILCFDGDSAGARAAARAAELALPMLSPERTLRVASLPAGEDPDSLVRAHGAAGFQAAVASARPLVESLYDLIREGTGTATPEQKAALRRRLEEAARRIPDRALSIEYRQALLDRFFAATRSPRKARAPRLHLLVRPTPEQEGAAAERARILTAILLRHPNLLPEVGHAYETLALPAPLQRVREALEAWSDHRDVLDSKALIDHLTFSGLKAEVDFALASAPVPLPACAATDSRPAEAHEGWWHIFGFLSLDRLREEVRAAQNDAARNLTKETQDRAAALKAALNKVMAGEPDGSGLVA